MEDTEEVKYYLNQHLEMLKTTQLGDEPGPKITVHPFGAPSSALRVLSARYYQALANSVIRLRRYERSILAWSKLLGQMDENTRETIVVDYVIPVLHLAEDLPGIIKDQVIRAAVSFERLASTDGSMREINSIRRNDWIDLFSSLPERDPEAKLLVDRVDKLWKPAEAKRLRDWHGNAHHDVEPQILSEIPSVIYMGGVEYEGVDEAVDINVEINCIDVQRVRAEVVYADLCDYSVLLESRVENIN